MLVEERSLRLEEYGKKIACGSGLAYNLDMRAENSERITGKSEGMNTHIALLMLDKNYGGMQNAFVNYSIELEKRGYSVLSIMREEALAEDMLLENNYSSIVKVKNRFGFYDAFAIRKITDQLIRFFDNAQRCFIMTFGGRATLFAGKSKRSHPSWKIVASLPNRVNHKYYQYADILVPSTRKMADESYHKDLVNPRFSEVIPRFSRVKPAAQVLLKKEIRNLFAVGRLVPKKGFDYLLYAMSEIVAEHPDVRLKIAGDGSERENLTKICNELSLDSKVELLGYRKDVAQLLIESDLLVVPSVDEPFGNVILEGMATGTPIVTTRNDGAKEILNETTALFADVASAESLAEAVLKAIDNPEEASQRAEKPLQVFKQRYIPDVVISKLNSVFD